MSAAAVDHGPVTRAAAGLPREPRGAPADRPPGAARSAPAALDRQAGLATPRTALGGLAAVAGLALLAAALWRRRGPRSCSRRLPEVGGSPPAAGAPAPTEAPQPAFVHLRSADDLASAA
jgi:hypothetical protein